jgi:hypothetical protein
MVVGFTNIYATYTAERGRGRLDIGGGVVFSLIYMIKMVDRFRFSEMNIRA